MNKPFDPLNPPSSQSNLPAKPDKPVVLARSGEPGEGEVARVTPVNDFLAGQSASLAVILEELIRLENTTSLLEDPATLLNRIQQDVATLKSEVDVYLSPPPELSPLPATHVSEPIAAHLAAHEDPDPPLLGPGAEGRGGDEGKKDAKDAGKAPNHEKPK